jgi:hypothetical protein
MFITELYDLKSAEGFRTEKEDNSVRKLSDVRKSRLTLAQIKRLRIMNDLKKFERQKEIDDISKQYRPAAASGAMPGI